MMDPAAPLLELLDSIELAEDGASWVGEWWHAEVPNILHRLPELENKNDLLPSCQMDTLGRYLLHILRVVSLFAELLVDGDYISRYTERILEELLDADDGTLLVYVDTKADALR